MYPRCSHWFPGHLTPSVLTRSLSLSSNGQRRSPITAAKRIERPIKGRLVGDTPVQKSEKHSIVIGLLDTRPIRRSTCSSSPLNLLMTTIGCKTLVPELVIQRQPGQPFPAVVNRRLKGLINDLQQYDC